MAATIQIVDKVGTSGVVLLDLNLPLGGVMLGHRDEVALAQVQVQQQGDQGFSWSPAAHAGGPAELAARAITVPVVLFSASSDATAALARSLQELTRSRFILKIQRHGSTVPVWIRCMPCSPQLNTQVSAAGQHPRIVTGSLTTQTEPYALGARVDVGPVTITQDPASGTPFVWDIGSVAGDSLTPLVIRSGDTGLTAAEDRILISTRRRGTPSSLTGLVVQGESATLGSAGPTVATFTGDTTFSGSSGARATYDVDGAWTATFVFSSLAGAEVPGTYRLLIRARRSGEAAGQLITLSAAAGPLTLVESFTAGGNDLRVIDMGLIQVPVGQPPMMSAPETPVRASGPTIVVTVTKQTATVTPSNPVVDLDWAMLVPADQDTGVLENRDSLSGSVIALDGYDHTPRVWSADPYTGSTPSAVGSSTLAWVGGAPRLRPGANRLYVVLGLGTSTASARTPASSIALSGSYWPRYGWLA